MTELQAVRCDLVCPRRRLSLLGSQRDHRVRLLAASRPEFTRPPPPSSSPPRSGSVRPSSSKEREEAAHHRAAKDVSFEPRAAVAGILATPSARSAGSLLQDVCCASSSLCQPKRPTPGARWRRLADVEHQQAPARRRLTAFLHGCSGTSWRRDHCAAGVHVDSEVAGGTDSCSSSCSTFAHREQVAGEAGGAAWS